MIHLKNSVLLFKGRHMTGGVSPWDPEQSALLIEPVQSWVFPTVNLVEWEMFTLLNVELAQDVNISNDVPSIIPSILDADILKYRMGESKVVAGHQSVWSIWWWGKDYIIKCLKQCSGTSPVWFYESLCWFENMVKTIRWPIFSFTHLTNLHNIVTRDF